MPDALLYEKRRNIAYLTLNRPAKRNTINPEMACRLHDAWLDYEKDDKLRCAILTAAGTETFTAGADLGTLIPLLTRAQEPQDDWDRQFMSNPMRILGVGILSDYSIYKPIIMVVNGVALAGGTEILHPADIRLAVPHALFGLPEVKRAVFPGASLNRLPRSIAYAKAMEMLLVGDAMSAEEAERIGWINEVVPADRIMDRAEQIAQKIVAKSPETIRIIKQGVLDTSSGLPLGQAYRYVMELARQAGPDED